MVSNGAEKLVVYINVASTGNRWTELKLGTSSSGVIATT